MNYDISISCWGSFLSIQQFYSIYWSTNKHIKLIYFNLALYSIINTIISPEDKVGID
jgi:hypothetical protein